MKKADYDIDFFKQFKTHEARISVVQFVTKTLDKIACPMLTSEKIHIDFFKVKNLITTKFKRFDEMQFLLHHVQALKLGKYSIAAN